MAKARIANRIRALREEAGLTQTDLADRCACTRQTIIALEQERYVPSLSLAFAIAAVFDARVDVVFRPENEA